MRKPYNSKKTAEEIAQIQKMLLNEKDPSKKKQLQLLEKELEIKKEYHQRQEKKLQKEQQLKSLKEELLKRNDFFSANVHWKISGTTFLNSSKWKGFVNNQHVFNITFRRNIYELTIVPDSKNNLSLEEAVKNAEKILEKFNDTVYEYDYIVERTEQPGAGYYKLTRLDSKQTKELTQQELEEYYIQTPKIGLF